jgi:2-oxoglutarate/2-oxoacid ferredoxin oxidoreductase subunit alpha
VGNTAPLFQHLVEGAELETLQSSDRYTDTHTGISKRWLPGTSCATYNLNSDEHTADGTVTEEAEAARKMMEKRMRKLSTLADNLPEPELYGNPEAHVTFVGWGSVKNAVLDAISAGANANYLHFEFLYPLKTTHFQQLVAKAQHTEQATKTRHRFILIEQNYFGQLGQLLAQETGFKFSEKLLKYDGRPFFVEEVLECV